MRTVHEAMLSNQMIRLQICISSTKLNAWHFKSAWCTVILKKNLAQQKVALNV